MHDITLHYLVRIALIVALATTMFAALYRARPRKSEDH